MPDDLGYGAGSVPGKNKMMKIEIEKKEKRKRGNEKKMKYIPRRGI